MRRSRTIVPALLCALAPSLVGAQALSLTGVTSSGDCAPASFHQSSGPSGKYIAAEWAAASGFPVPINRGRVRCVLRMTVAVPVGHKVVVGSATAAPTLMAVTQFSPLQLRGAASRALVSAALSVDTGTPVTGTAMAASGPMTTAGVNLDRPPASAAPEGVCATAAKSSFIITAAVDAATASDYVVPWPPEPYEQREVASLGSVRLFYAVVPCPPTRTAPSGRAVLPP